MPFLFIYWCLCIFEKKLQTCMHVKRIIVYMLLFRYNKLYISLSNCRNLSFIMWKLCFCHAFVEYNIYLLGSSNVYICGWWLKINSVSYIKFIVILFSFIAILSLSFFVKIYNFHCKISIWNLYCNVMI